MREDKSESRQFLIRHYDDTAKAYHQAHYRAPRSYSPFWFRQRYIEDMIESLSLPPGARILDVGCGPGELIVSLVRNGFEVWGVDISKSMIETARSVLRENGFTMDDHLSVGDVESLEFADAFFDVVVAAGVIEYQKEDRAALQEMRRVLKPGGHLILNVTNKFGWQSLLEGPYQSLKTQRVLRRVFDLVKCRVSRRGPLKDYPERRMHSPPHFDRLLRSMGFTKVSFSYFSFSPLPTPVDTLLPFICRPVGRKMEALARSRWALLLGGGYLVMARR